jgi:hypothetical protein
MSAFASTGIMAGCLCIVHPYLMAFAIPDIFYLLAFSRSIARCTVHEMVCKFFLFNIICILGP